jgi:hypothetical protein
VRESRSAIFVAGTRRARPGLMLAELAVIVTLAGLIAGLVGMTLVRQQRFYSGASEQLQAREDVRDAMELLSSDIRGTSITDTLRLVADSAIELFASIGTSVVCQTIAGARVDLPRQSPAPLNALTAFITLPDTGDIAVFHRDSLGGSSEWERHRIAGVAAQAGDAACPAVAGSAIGFQLQLATPLTPQVHAGSPVRFIRRGRYSIYRASDGQWYLGYRRCNATGEPSTCGVIQPLSGPYAQYSADANSTGLLFEYFNAAGRGLKPGDSPLEIARIDITARGAAGRRSWMHGSGAATAQSATLAVSIRNR